MIEYMVDFLNAALKQRTTSMHHVFLTIAVKATQKMIDHPTIQVTKDDYVRMIGMLNGCVSEGNKRIMMVMDDEDEKQILRFEIGEFVDGKLVQNGV